MRKKPSSSPTQRYSLEIHAFASAFCLTKSCFIICIRFTQNFQHTSPLSFSYFYVSISFICFYLGWRMGSKTLMGCTQQSTKLDLSFFQIISLSLAHSSYTRLCFSFYLVLNKMLKVLRHNGTCCERGVPGFYRKHSEFSVKKNGKWKITFRKN